MSKDTDNDQATTAVPTTEQRESDTTVAKPTTEQPRESTTVAHKTGDPSTLPVEPKKGRDS